MFCKKCGTKMDDNLTVCPQCGTPVAQSCLNQAAASQQQNAETPPPFSPASDSPNAVSGPSAQNTAPAQKALTAIKPWLKSKKLWGIAGAVLVLLIILIVVLAQPKTIALDKMLQAEFSGYNTAGSAHISLDTNKFDAAVAKALHMDVDSVSLSPQYIACRQALRLDPLYAENLSNGDKVVTKISYQNELISQFHIKFSGEEASFTVEGLAEPQKISPLDSLEVSFEGISPFGTASYRYAENAPQLNLATVKLDKTENLSNGDTVTATLEIPEGYNPAAEGYLVQETSKSFTVSGLAEYVTGYQDMDEEFLSWTKKEAEDLIRAQAASHYNNGSKLGTLEYAGYAFLLAKENVDGSAANIFYCVLRAVASNNKGGFPDTVVYFPVYFRNVLFKDGKISCDGTGEIVGNSPLGDGSYSTFGFNNPYSAYDAIITAGADRYTGEAGDGFEKYDTVPELKQYSDLTEEDLKPLIDRAEDLVTSAVSKSYPDSLKTEKVTLLGEYLLTAKAQGDDLRENNSLVIIYKTNVLKDGKKVSEAYFPISFKGLFKLPDGTLHYLSEKDLSSTFWLSGYGWSLHGYQDEETLFHDVVSARRDNYNYEVSGDAKDFGA